MAVYPYNLIAVSRCIAELQRRGGFEELEIISLAVFEENVEVLS